VTVVNVNIIVDWDMTPCGKADRHTHLVIYAIFVHEISKLCMVKKVN
jgi:hypothetical protein